MMSEHPELPDLIRKTGVPVPQVLDRSGETLAWKPAEDMAPKLDDLIEALGARATEQTLAQIKTALTDGSLKAQLSGNIAELINDGRTGVTLAAGATITAWFYLDVRTARRVTLVAKNQATGAYAKTSIGYRALTLGKRAISSANTMGAEVEAPCVSHTFEVTAPYVSVILKNGSTETQTYDIDAYLWRS